MSRKVVTVLGTTFNINYLFVISAFSKYTYFTEEYPSPIESTLYIIWWIGFLNISFYHDIYFSYFLRWFLLLHLLRSRKIFTISLCLSTMKILTRSLLHAFTDSCIDSVDHPLLYILLKLSPICNHRFFGVISVKPMLILQRISNKLPNFCLNYCSVFYFI